MSPIDIQAGIAIIVAVFGGIVASILGWAESNTSFDPKKFIVAVIRGGIGGLVITFAAILSMQMFSLLGYVELFLAAMGIDLASAKLSRIIKPAPVPAPA